MQTNAANDQLGSTGTATARAEMIDASAVVAAWPNRYNAWFALHLLDGPSVLQAASTRLPSRHAIGSQPSAEVPSRRKDRRRLVHAFTKASPKEVHRVASYATRRSCAYVQQCCTQQ